MSDKIDLILKEIGEIKTDIAVMKKGNEFWHEEIKSHKKTLNGNGFGWGIKNQVRILWLFFIAGLGIIYKRFGG